MTQLILYSGWPDLAIHYDVTTGAVDYRVFLDGEWRLISRDGYLAVLATAQARSLENLVYEVRAAGAR